MSAWRRVTRARPCPVCERIDWCGVSGDGGAAICMRVESAKPVRNGGYLHRLTDASWDGHRVARVRVRTDSTIDFGKLAERYRRTADAKLLARLAAQLGVSVESLRRLHVGFDGKAWTFPMRHATGRIVGIRRRFPDGRKLSVKGGREGLFVPGGLGDGGELFITEGPTDCAALLTLGFAAIGRPSCRGGVVELSAYAKARPPASIVIFGDGDSPGLIGARALGLALRLSCPVVRVIHPPDGVKDVRAWVGAGATRAMVVRHVSMAEPIRLNVYANRRLG